MQPLSQEPCELVDVPRRTEDSAALTVRAPAATPNECVLGLVAALLRPWPNSPLEPWTIAVAAVATSDTVPLSVGARPLRAGQARDALDAERVLVATEDLELVQYARARDDLAVVPLPWDRLYVRLGAPPDDSLGAVDPASVRTEARRAGALPECVPLSPTSPLRGRTQSSRVAYRLGDHTGRELAERVVGLGHANEVAGLDSAAFDAALSVGADRTYIVALMLTGDPCDALHDLLRRAPWADRESIAPLIETRAYGITRRGSAP